MNLNSFLLAILIVICSVNFYEQQQTKKAVARLNEWQKMKFQEYQTEKEREIQERDRLIAQMGLPNFRQPEKILSDITDGGYIQKPAPPYPAEAREREEEGTVKVEVIVSGDGQVESTRVISSSGSPRLDKAAKEAAQQAKYRAKKIDGVEVRTRFVAGYSFKLN